MPIEVRAPGERFLTRAEGRTTYHSFSFGAHYDPHNIGFGALVAHNDEWMPPGSGYADHPHRDLEIVTWVLCGALRHTSSSGETGLIEPGQVQRLSAGSGVVHSEVSASPGETRFLQVWVRPDEPDLVPSYVAAAAPPPHNAFLCVASGDDGGVVPLHARGTSMHVGLLDAGTSVALPESPRLHVFVAAGAATLGDRLLAEGATGRLIDQGGRSISATEPGTELVVWALP